MHFKATLKVQGENGRKRSHKKMHFQVNKVEENKGTVISQITSNGYCCHRRRDKN